MHKRSISDEPRKMKPKDANELAVRIVGEATSEDVETTEGEEARDEDSKESDSGKNLHALALGRVEGWKS